MYMYSMTPEISQNTGNCARPIYKTVVLMKTHPLRHGVSFHPSFDLTFSFSSLKQVRKSRKKVLINLRLLFISSHKKPLAHVTQLVMHPPLIGSHLQCVMSGRDYPHVSSAYCWNVVGSILLYRSIKYCIESLV